MQRFWSWINTFNTAASVASLLGVTVSFLAAFSAFVWARVENLRLSYLLLVTLAVFTLALWSWIGIIWLVERAKAASSVTSSKPQIDCAWGLVVDGGFIGFDPPSHSIVCQVSIQIRNRLSWPLRMEVIHRSLEIDHKTPDVKSTDIIPVVIMPGTPLTLNLDGYSVGKIETGDVITGKVELTIRYGHPDWGYTRIMSRWFSFTQRFTPHPLFAGSNPLPPIIGKFPLPISNSKEEEDKPFVPTR